MNAAASLARKATACGHVLGRPHAGQRGAADDGFAHGLGRAAVISVWM